MQFSTITALAFSLFAAQAIAQSTTCGTPGEQCNTPNETACQCNGGNLVQCGATSGGTGFTWSFYGDCPPNGGGFTCVNGACTVTKKLRRAI